LSQGKNKKKFVFSLDGFQGGWYIGSKMKDQPKTPSARLQIQLHLRGLTPWKVQKLAEKQGETFHYQTIDHWIAGRAQPSLNSLTRLAGIIGCEVRDLT
jgi:hypothetical protein